jgi:hypothetical protein
VYKVIDLLIIDLHVRSLQPVLGILAGVHLNSEHCIFLFKDACRLFPVIVLFSANR